MTGSFLPLLNIVEYFCRLLILTPIQSSNHMLWYLCFIQYQWFHKPIKVPTISDQNEKSVTTILNDIDGFSLNLSTIKKLDWTLMTI
jgi:hypothetical protein